MSVGSESAGAPKPAATRVGPGQARALYRLPVPVSGWMRLSKIKSSVAGHSPARSTVVGVNIFAPRTANATS